MFPIRGQAKTHQFWLHFHRWSSAIVRRQKRTPVEFPKWYGTWDVGGAAKEAAKA